jgi:hypothetical protein
MLCSLYLAILIYFQQKNGIFLENQCNDILILPYKVYILQRFKIQRFKEGRLAGLA